MEKIDKIINDMPLKNRLITRREYEWLKTFNVLEPHELQKIKEFEDSLEASKIEAKKEKTPIQRTPGIVPNKKNIWNGFLQAFRFVNNREFVQNPETIANLEPILKYFVKDESFFDSKNLLKHIHGKQLTNSFEKGLLIIGDYGNGKTTIMKCFEMLFKRNYEIAIHENWDNIHLWNKLRFKGCKSHDVVTEFESISSPEGKDLFYKKYSSFRYYFDDVKKEKTASNYGKSEIMRDLIEKRYDRQALTYMTCNYKEGYSGDIEEALIEFGEKYGGHVYDRMFEMYNIIEFKGKSFRR